MDRLLRRLHQHGKHSCFTLGIRNWSNLLVSPLDCLGAFLSENAGGLGGIIFASDGPCHALGDRNTFEVSAAGISSGVGNHLFLFNKSVLNSSSITS